MDKPKTRKAAYLWWFFLGGLGAHRFYLRQKRAGYLIIAYVVITTVVDLLFYDTAPFFYNGTFAMMTNVPFWAFLLSEAFRIPKWVDKINDEEHGHHVFD